MGRKTKRGGSDTLTVKKKVGGPEQQKKATVVFKQTGLC